MLDYGIKYFDEEIKETTNGQSNGEIVIASDKAFYLYDTLGFPIDLAQLMVEEAGMTVDTKGFEAEMETQKQPSREAQLVAKGMTGQQLELTVEQTAWLADDGIEVMDDSFKYV